MAIEVRNRSSEIRSQRSDSQKPDIFLDSHVVTGTSVELMALRREGLIARDLLSSKVEGDSVLSQ